MSFKQFYILVTKSLCIWDGLFAIRLLLRNFVFDDERVVVDILERKKNIKNIKRYKIAHRGKLPYVSCQTNFINCILCKPNPYQFDYSFDDDENHCVSFINFIICDVIKLYNPNFHHGGLVNQHVFLLKIPVSYKYSQMVNKYFLLYASQNSNISSTPTKITTSFTFNLSEYNSTSTTKGESLLKNRISKGELTCHEPRTSKHSRVGSKIFAFNATSSKTLPVSKSMVDLN